METSLWYERDLRAIYTSTHLPDEMLHDQTLSQSKRDTFSFSDNS